MAAMQTALRSSVIATLFLLLALLPAGAQSPEPSASPSATPVNPEGTRTVTVEIRITDKFGRLFLAPPQSVKLGVKLKKDDNADSLKDVQALEDPTEGLTYTVDGDYTPFTLKDGVAKAQFVVYEDSSKPVLYRLALQQKTSDGWTGWTPFRDPFDPANGEQRGLATTVIRSMLPPEKALMIVFVGVAFIAAWLLFGRELFRRMLFNRRMEVANAESTSSLLWMGFVVLACALAVGVYFNPIVLWGNPYYIYVTAILGYLAFTLVSYGIGVAVTRRA